MSTEDVIQALTLAFSQDPALLKVGERQLEAWKPEKGFYSTLANVFCRRELDSGVRWMAITCLKNGVDQFWRPGAPHAIPDEEKSIVRASILQCFEEPVSQVANQLAVLTARIARIDCPNNWPDLLPVLSEGVRSSSDFTRKCYLNVLKHIIKTLAGRRLPNQRKVFCDVTSSLFVYIVGLWNTHLQSGVAQLSEGNAESAIYTLEMARVCLKILRQMIVYGMVKFHAIIEALQFLSTLLERIPALLQLRSQIPSGHSATEIIEKNIQLKMKILMEVQSNHAIGYAQFVTPTLKMIHHLVFTPENEGQLFEKLVISCLNLLRYIIRCEDYNPPRAELTQSVLPPGVMEAHRAKLEFFKSSICELTLEKLVCKYMLLSEDELESWNADTEEFYQDKAGEMHDYSFRECVENVMVALVHEFQSTLTPALLHMIQAVQSTNASNDFQDIRLKEAVYKAAGLCAFQLYDDVDFDSWYQTQLLHELSVQDPKYKLVRHRVVWLLGTWVTVKMSSELRPSVYSVLVPLLTPIEHLAVRLAAAEAIKICVDDFDFTVDDFSPFLSDATSLLFQLLLDVSTPDTKMKVLNTLSLLLERMGSAIQPHIAALLRYLPQLWAESADHKSSMLRCVILSTLNNIMVGLGQLSANLHNFVLPVIQLATSVKEPEHVYLAEDGLVLWLTTLHSAPSTSPDLLHLLRNMVGLLGISPVTDDSTPSMSGLMDIGSDNLEICFKIMGAYVVLCASEVGQFMQTCAEIIVQSSRYYISDVKPEAIVNIIKVISLMVQVFPKQLTQLVQPLLPLVLRKFLQEDDYPPTTSVYVDLIGRVLVSDPGFFFLFLERMATDSQQTASHLFGLLIDTWSERLDSVSNVRYRKLTGLAVANLLPITDPCVTSRFSVLVNMCVEVLHDVMDIADDGELFDSLVSGAENVSVTQPTETEHDKREKQLALLDPVRTVALNKYITAKLEDCVTVHGHHGYKALMVGVDPAVREQLFEFLPRQLAQGLVAFDAIP